MNKIIRIFSIVVLLFLAIGGLYGGWTLIDEPSGSEFGWTVDILEGTPFKDFLIPGIILWLFMGLMPLVVTYFTLIKGRYYYWLIVMQGIILFIWLTTEIILSRDLYSPVFHPTFYAVAGLLILCGFLLFRSK